MTRVLALVVAAGVVLAPPAASAWTRHGGAVGGPAASGGRSFAQHGVTHAHHGGLSGFGAPRGFVRHARPFTVIGSPLIYYYPPAYYPPPYYAPSAISYGPPVDDARVYGAPVGYGAAADGMVSLAPSMPPPARVPYPASPPPPAWITMPPPPPTPSPVDGATSDEPAPRRLSRLYHWIDEAGVSHWTDRLDSVPLQYRDRQ